MINKKGDIFQVTFLLIILLVIALIGLIFFKLSWEITSAYAEMEEINDTETAREANITVKKALPYFFDELVFFIFIGGIIALMAAAVKTKFSPVIIGLFIIMIFFTVLVASGFVNIYQGFAQSESLTDVSSQLPLTNILFSKYTPLIFAIIGGVVLIVMYSKSGSDIVT